MGIISVKRRLLALTLCLAAVSTPAPARAYLKLAFRTNGGLVVAHWPSMPVRYFVADRGVPEVRAADLRSAADRAFASWEAVPSASAAFQFVGFTPAAPGDEDGMTTLGFRDRPDLDRVVGATEFLIDDTNGDILEADIFFNSVFSWSVAPAGETGRFDLESIALHEIGHLLGLGHSALGETELRPGGGRRVLSAGAVMFPIAFAPGSIALRTLQPDDVAAVSDLYPDGQFRRRTGSLSGRVTRNGRGLLGAHVVAFNPATGALIGGFSLGDRGEFAIAGLSPGPHVIRVEPLDDADIDSFFDDGMRVDVDFRATFSDRFAIVPRGGNAPDIDVAVGSK